MKTINLESSRSWKSYTDEELGGSRPDKSVCLIRYGGFGDHIMLSSVFPLLKEQGYHVCVNVTDRGGQVLKHDPHIDELIIQQADFVPNSEDAMELDDWWARLSPLFWKMVNLSEVTESTLLVQPHDPRFGWAQAKRHRDCNENYLERIHKHVGVKYDPNPRFYPSAEEKIWADEQYNQASEDGKRMVVLWPLAGSSVHKVYPHLDDAMTMILKTHPQTRIVLVGMEACQVLEIGWEEDSSIWCRSGKWTIRETMAFALRCDCVIGPETGVMNAVSHEPMSKVMLLSHSSVKNLIRDWVNTRAPIPQRVPCWPCHKMIYRRDQCLIESTTRQAACQYSIEPGIIVQAMGPAFRQHTGKILEAA